MNLQVLGRPARLVASSSTTDELMDMVHVLENECILGDTGEGQMCTCIFCAIVAGEAPASVVYQDESCTAFLDIQPITLGHLLVVPNVHATYLADMDEDMGAQLFRVAQRLAGCLRHSGLKCEGVNLFLADGEAAMQEVLHVHLHVFPRFAGDGFGLTFGPNYRNKPDRSVLDRAAHQIKRVLEARGDLDAAKQNTKVSEQE